MELNLFINLSDVNWLKRHSCFIGLRYYVDDIYSVYWYSVHNPSSAAMNWVNLSRFIINVYCVFLMELRYISFSFLDCDPVVSFASFNTVLLELIFQ